MLSGEAANANLILLFDQVCFEPTTFHTRGKHANHYTTEAVLWGGKFMILYCLETWTITLYRLLFVQLWNNKEIFFNPYKEECYHCLAPNVDADVDDSKPPRPMFMLPQTILTSCLFDVKIQVICATWIILQLHVVFCCTRSFQVNYWLLLRENP